MGKRIVTILDDHNHPGKDVFGRGIRTRQHYLHCVMALSDEPLGSKEIGRRAERLAKVSGHAPINPTTFGQQATASHLSNFMKRLGFAEQVGTAKWELTAKAKKRIARAVGPRV